MTHHHDKQFSNPEKILRELLLQDESPVLDFKREIHAIDDQVLCAGRGLSRAGVP